LIHSAEDDKVIWVQKLSFYLPAKIYIVDGQSHRPLGLNLSFVLTNPHKMSQEFEIKTLK